MEKLGINKKLLPVKIHYFLLNGAHSGVIVFIPIYAQQLGISASAVGVILAVLSCLTVVSKTAFGSIADHFQKLKHVLLFLILLDVAADLGLNFIPKPYQAPVNRTSDKFFCYQGNSYIIHYEAPDCSFGPPNSLGNCSWSCSLCLPQSIYCSDRNDSSPSIHRQYFGEIAIAPFNDTFKQQVVSLACLHDNTTKCSESCFDGSAICRDITGTNFPLQLWLLGIFATLIFIANGSIVSLSDAACFNALGDRPQNYGKQRMWGTVGWGSFALLTGYLNQIFTGSSKVYSYSSGFYLLIVLFAVDFFVITKLRLKNVKMSKNLCRDVGDLLVKPKILLFIMEMFGIGIVTGISRSYLFWYLRTTLKASQFALGITAGIQCFFGELPFFFFSGLIIRKLGHINTFTMSFLAYGLKFMSHSFLTNAWWALPVELLQGPCFGSFYSAMTSYSKLISPPGTEATMQGVVSGIFEGLGAATGNLLAGFCINNFGGRTTFYWTGVISLAVGVAHWLIHFIINRRKTVIQGNSSNAVI